MQRTANQSQQHSTGNSDTGHGCGLNIALIGLAIAVMAVGYALVRSAFTIDPAQADLVPTVATDSIAAPSPTPTPTLTSTPAPDVTAVPTPQPATTSIPPLESHAEADNSDYLEMIGRVVPGLSESFDRFVVHLSSANFGDPNWMMAVEAEMELWQSLHDDAASVDVPERHHGSHETLLKATGSFVAAIQPFRDGFNNVDPNGIATGFQQLGEALIHLNAAGMQLDRER